MPKAQKKSRKFKSERGAGGKTKTPPWLAHNYVGDFREHQMQKCGTGSLKKRRSFKRQGVARYAEDLSARKKNAGVARMKDTEKLKKHAGEKIQKKKQFGPTGNVGKKMREKSCDNR